MRDEDIDAEVTWVDGADPVLQAKQARYRPAHAQDPAAAATRFADSGEISMRWPACCALRLGCGASMW